MSEKEPILKGCMLSDSIYTRVLEMTKPELGEGGGVVRKGQHRVVREAFCTLPVAVEERAHKDDKMACKTGNLRPMGCLDASLLAVILYCGCVRCYRRGKLGRGYAGSLCATAYNCL